MAKKKEADKSSQNDNKITKTDGAEDEEPNFSDDEDYVDDVSDEELLGDLLKDHPSEKAGVESIIVVDGIPQVGPERFDKLKAVIIKFFNKFGEIINEYFPKNETGQTKGYVFLEYASPENAKEAVATANQHKLDKQHTFLVNLFSDFSKYEDIPDEWEPPQPQPYKEQTDLCSFLMDPDAYDQFSVICNRGNTVQIWQNTAPEPSRIEDRARWTETFVQWSPLGTYLATFHIKGIALWGGPNFERLMKFSHAGVQYIEFSPCERYIVSYSPQAENTDPMKMVIIWDIRTGQEKRSFSIDGTTTWPIFRWSKDDKYFARIGLDVLSVYETPSFGLLHKKSIKLVGIRDFSWSPTDNILAYWVAENKDVPARVVLIEIPSRVEIRANNLFNVASCTMHWQKSGDYLCVKVDRFSKVKKEKGENPKYSGMYYNFEIFHLREKNIPKDSEEVKEAIHAFAWEPVGNKFAIIHGESPNICVSFYGVKTGQKPTMLKRLEKRVCNNLFWSPMGQFIVLADLRANGILEFVDTNDFTVMNTTDHFQVTDVEWDPTGRYVVTAVSYWKVKVDTGYWIWSFQGKIIKRNNLEGFCNFMWRPRPPTLLSVEQQKEIRKNLKKYSPQFESKDRMRMTKASKELMEKRSKLMKDFEEIRNRQLDIWKSQKPRRLELRTNVDTDELDSDTKNVEEEVVEFFVKEEIAVVE